MTQLDLAPLAPVDSAPLSAPVDTTPIDRAWPRTDGGDPDIDFVCSQEEAARRVDASRDRLATNEGRRPRSDKGKPREQLTLSKSEIERLRSCPQRYYYEYEQGRRPASESSESAEWGLYVHRALEQSFTVLQHEGGIEAGEGIALNQLDSHGTDHQGRPYGPPSDPYARAMLRAVVRGYIATWGPGDAEGFDVLAVENRYELPALRPDGKPRRGFSVDGVIDLTVRNREDGNVWILDHKTTRSDFERTTSSGEQAYFIGAELDAQAIGYVDVAARQGLNPAGFMWDLIKRPGLARVEKVERGESAEGFEERMVSVITGNAARYFARYPITFEPWQIARARADVIATGEEILLRRRLGLWQQNRDACGKFGATCPWMPVCTGRARADDDRLYPLKRRVEKEGSER